jgi:hypothetical protein
MPNDISGKELLCSRCNEPLREVPCSACRGRGYIRAWVFWKRECDACRALGTNVACLNERSHLAEDLRLSAVKDGVLEQGSRGRAVSKRTVDALSNTAPKRRWLIPPWNNPDSPIFRVWTDARREEERRRKERRLEVGRRKPFQK